MEINDYSNETGDSRRRGIESKNLMEGKGFQIHESRGANFTLFGVVGDTAAFDMNQLRVYDCIDKVMRVQEPYKRANRMFHPEDSIVDVCGVKVGGKQITVMAGPCSVETREQIIGVAEDVKQMGAAILRGGAFKPRTSHTLSRDCRKSDWIY